MFARFSLIGPYKRQIAQACSLRLTPSPMESKLICWDPWLGSSGVDRIRRLSSTLKRADFNGRPITKRKRRIGRLEMH